MTATPSENRLHPLPNTKHLCINVLESTDPRKTTAATTTRSWRRIHQTSSLHSSLDVSEIDKEKGDVKIERKFSFARRKRRRRSEIFTFLSHSLHHNFGRIRAAFSGTVGSCHRDHTNQMRASVSIDLALPPEASAVDGDAFKRALILAHFWARSTLFPLSLSLSLSLSLFIIYILSHSLSCTHTLTLSLTTSLTVFHTQTHFHNIFLTTSFTLLQHPSQSFPLKHTFTISFLLLLSLSYNILWESFSLKLTFTFSFLLLLSLVLFPPSLISENILHSHSLLCLTLQLFTYNSLSLSIHLFLSLSLTHIAERCSLTLSFTLSPTQTLALKHNQRTNTNKFLVQNGLKSISTATKTVKVYLLYLMLNWCIFYQPKVAKAIDCLREIVENNSRKDRN